MRTASNKVKISIQPTIERILATGQMTRRDHLQLTSKLLSDHQITDQDRQQINHLLEAVHVGQLKLVES